MHTCTHDLFYPFRVFGLLITVSACFYMLLTCLAVHYLRPRSGPGYKAYTISRFLFAEVAGHLEFWLL